MTILLGVDTLSYHCRIAEREISLEDVFREVADLGAEFVQINAVHVRDRDWSQVESLRVLAESLSLGITLSGDVVGRAGDGDTVEEGAERIRGWVRLAEVIGSPFARVSSGFYRNELLAFPDRIVAEQRYVTDTLRRAAAEVPGEVSILLENHSDFTADEYARILGDVGSGRVAVFLDLINPISALQDPLAVVDRLAPLATAGHAKDYRIESRYVEDRFHRRGFDVQWCYPGEGVADLTALTGAIASVERDAPYHLSVEGLDNHPRVADQRERITSSLEFLRSLLPARAGL